MSRFDFNKFCLAEDHKVQDALVCLNGNSIGVVFVLSNSNGSLLGTVSDGDIRRAFLRGINLTDPIKMCMNSNFYAVRRGATEDAATVLRDKPHLKAIPELDGEGRILSIRKSDQPLVKELKTLPNAVVIMAGGKGERLMPLTKDCPKPMLRVGGKPIIQIIIETFKAVGIRSFFISVNYKKKKIKDFFGDGSAFGVSITYLEEQIKTGTAGSLGLIEEEIESPVFVINGDLLLEVDLLAMLRFHQESRGSITIGVKEMEFELPYGVIRHNGREVTEVTEKPVYKEFASAGLYILEPAIINDMVGAKCLDMPDLIKESLEKQMTVIPFIIHEKWLDIGHLMNLEEARKNW